MKTTIKWSVVFLVFVSFSVYAFKMESDLNQTERTLQEMGEDAYFDVWRVLEDSLQRNPTRAEIANYYLENHKN